MLSHNKHNIIVIFFSLILILGAYATLTPVVHAENLDDSTLKQQESLALSNDVVGLDLSKYQFTQKTGNHAFYMGILPQEDVRYTLESDGSKLDIVYTFINGNLQKINVLENEGTPRLTKTTANVLGAAKEFLGNFQTYSRNVLYGILESTLTTVDSSKNSTSISGNTKLEVTVEGASTTFRWIYSYNGIEAPDKCVVLSYENGFLKYFLDNWNLYKIGSTTVNLSEKEAINMAMERAKTYSWIAPASSDVSKTIGNGTFMVMKFNVTNAMLIETVFASSLYVDKVHSQDPFELYPLRHVWVSLDKFYPGNVYGMNVYLWADTNEICYIHERVTTFDPPSDLVASFEDCVVAVSNDQASTVEVDLNSVSVDWLVFPTFAVVVLCAVVFWLGWRKNSLVVLRLLKLHWCKVSGVMLCVLTLSMLLFPLSTVNATPLQGRSTIWGSESVGAYNYTISPPSSMRKTNQEVNQQRLTAQYINGLFAGNSYNASDFQGNKGLIQRRYFVPDFL